MSEVTLYGAPWCPDCKRAKKFLAEHRIAYDWVDIDIDQAGLEYVERLQSGGRTIPTIVFADGSYLLEPGNDELAVKLGLSLEATRRTYDLIIVGGGPTGLAAAIYAAREGIEALVVDKAGLGGQAGVTERIDNYPGFPEGIGGGDLADRFIAQARRYGVELLSAVEVTGLAPDSDTGSSPDRGGNSDSGGSPDRNGNSNSNKSSSSSVEICVTLRTGQQVAAPAVLIATGSTYRRLGVPGEDDLIGAGVHFCATCDGPFYRGAQELLVIGGGNSALEEALYLTEFADRVHVLAHGPALRASKLLQDKVLTHPAMTVHLNTEVVSMARADDRQTKDRQTEDRQTKDRHIEIIARDSSTGAESTYRPAAAFVFIGLDPNTGWLAGGDVALDQWGFITTDGMFATSMAGVFAAGDVRAGSTKQLGSASGDGIAALISIRSYLQRHEEIRKIDVNA